MANQGEELPPCAQGTITVAHNLNHRKKLLDDLDGEGRSFLKSAFVAGGGAAAWAASGTLASPASAQTRAGQPTYHYLPAPGSPLTIRSVSSPAWCVTAPGVPVDHSIVQENHNILKNVRIPIRPHFGVMGVAPKEADIVDSIPPSYFGGNMDNWRVGKGATRYYPIAVPGGLFSIGDSHAAQGDSELCGTAIEMSLTGTFQLILHKQNTLTGSLAGLNYPLLETQDEWVMHGFSFANYLEELGPTAQQDIYKKSSIDLALRDAFRKMRSFLMTTKGLSEDEAVSLMSIGVDFGVTQVVDGNWGIHAIIKKSLFAGTVTA